VYFVASSWVQLRAITCTPKVVGSDLDPPVWASSVLHSSFVSRVDRMNKVG